MTLVELVELRRPRSRVLVVADVDGVLVDSSARHLYASAMSRGDRRRYWRLFLDPEAALRLDAPNPHAARLVESLLRGHRADLAVVTGRPRRMLAVTLRQVEALRLSPALVAVRPEGVYAKSWELKRAAAELLASRGYTLAAWVDDDPAALDAVRGLARLVVLYSFNPRPLYASAPSG